MKNNDTELIHCILDGDETAFSTLVEKYHKQVHALAWRKIGDFHIAEEITQDTFLKAYQKLAMLKKPHRFAGWLYVIATRCCQAWLRKKQIQTESIEELDSDDIETEAYSRYVVEQEAKVTVAEQRQVVKKLLATLPESERTVITLHYFGEMTCEAMSEFLGVSTNTIKSRLRRARNRLKTEEPMIREAITNFQISPNLTENIMQEISRFKPAPSGGKPFVPWAIGISVAAIVLLMLSLNSQHLSRFQKPYSFNAASEMKVELIDVPVVLNLESEPDDRTQLGNANAQGKNNGSDQQANNAAPLELETIVTKMKHYDNSVTSVTGDFVMERRYEGAETEKDEYTLTFAGKKVRVEREKRDAVNLPLVEYWDGKQQWGVYRPDNLLFKVEIAPEKERTILEKVQQAFKQVGIEITDNARIVAGDLSNSFRVIENDKTYVVLFVGETTLEVYDRNVGYSVRPSCFINDLDPRFWLTHSKASDDSYLSQPLWQLLEKHESELIGSEVLNGEMTSVIHLNITRSNGDFKIPDLSIKLWISHNIGFRLVKSEGKLYSEENPPEWSPFKAGVTYINTRKIDYHEYLPNVWFPKRIERSIVPEKLPEQQQGANFISKWVLLTKQCQVNADVSQLLSLDLSTNTSVYDYGVGHPRTMGDLEVKPNFQTQLGGSDVPSQNTGSEQQVNNATTPDSQQRHLPKGAKTRFGKGSINKIGYSPDGKHLVVVSSVGIWLYDPHSGKELDLLTEHTGSIAFNPNGNILASVSSSGGIHLWDTRTSTLLQTMTGDTSRITNMVFSGDGKMLASGSKDNSIYLWDTQSGEIRLALNGHADRIFSMSFSPDGTTLASASKDNTIRLWETQTGELQKTLDLEHSQEIFEMAFSPDGKTLASWAWESPIYLWDTQTGELRHTLTLHQMDVVNEFAFSPDGKTLASAMHNGTVRLWDVQTGEFRQILIGHTHWVLSVAFSPDGKTITSGSHDTTIRVWDIQTGTTQKTLTGYMNEVYSVVFSPDGKMLANSMHGDIVRVWDVQTGALRRTLKHQDMSGIQCIAFGSDGKTIASSGYAPAIHLWDMQTGTVRNTFRGHKDTVTSVAFSVDGTTLASASRDKTIHLYDTQTDELHKTLAGHTDWVMSVAFSPDGKTIASGGKDSTVRVWDVQTGELLKTLTEHTAIVNSVAFNPDGKTIASGSTDGIIHLWDAQTGDLLKSQVLQQDVLSLAFSPDGKTLASGCEDNTIHLWYTHINTVIRMTEGNSDWVRSVAFSPDGTTLASGSTDGTLLLWEITPDTTIIKP